MKSTFVYFTVLLSASACASTSAVTVSESQFSSHMSQQYGFAADEVAAKLGKAVHKESIIKAMTRPAEAKPWHQYRNIFLKTDRITAGIAFFKTHRELLMRAEKEFGVDPYIITAIIGVETKYGANTGSYRVIDALKTLGFGYPKRADFFRKQLEEFFLMSREENIDVLKPKGSYAGAMGMPQFIPSSFRSYAIDFDGDNQRDLWNNPADVIGSVANYFSEHGWNRGAPVARKLDTRPEGIQAGSRHGQKPNLTRHQLKTADTPLTEEEADINLASLIELQQTSTKEYWLGFNNFYVITRYNHSNLYAMAVYQLAEEIRKGMTR